MPILYLKKKVMDEAVKLFSSCAKAAIVSVDPEMELFAECDRMENWQFERTVGAILKMKDDVWAGDKNCPLKANMDRFIELRNCP